MNLQNQNVSSPSDTVKTARHFGGALALGLVLATSGCFSHPAPVVEAPPMPARIRFGGMAKEQLDDRSNVKTQEIVEEANRVWAARKTDAASYLRSARLINSALKEGEFSTPEEEVRLATMALQHALLANDTETLKAAVTHWDAGYSGIRKAPLGGEVETYLIALRRLDREMPEDLLNIAHPDIQIILKTES